MYSTVVAYVLGIISFIPPFNGLLRYYLKRHVTGTIFSLTAGCVWIGNILDIVQIPQLVRQANIKLKQQEMAMLAGVELAAEGPTLPAEAARRERSIEKYILQTAKRNKGFTTPSEVALESGESIEESRRALDYLVSKGMAELKVNRSGTIYYFIPDLLDDTREPVFDDI